MVDRENCVFIIPHSSDNFDIAVYKKEFDKYENLGVSLSYEEAKAWAISFKDRWNEGNKDFYKDFCIL